MASIIRIKRSSTAGNPTVLAAGELAYSAADYSSVAGGGRLYIGIGTESSGDAASHLVIGGQYFTDKLDHSPGTLTASSAVIVDADNKIDQFLVDNLKLDANTLSSTDVNGNILIDPNGSGYVQIVGTNALVIPSGSNLQQAPSVAGAIRLNTDTGQFEGYSGSNWGSLGGVKSVDGLTYISPELTPGASDDTLRFVCNGTLQMSLDTNSLDLSSTVVTVNIASTTASTNTSTGALIVAGGVAVGGNLNVGGNLSAADASFDSINDTPIGNITPSTGAFTDLDVDNININGNTISSGSGDINITPIAGHNVNVTNLYVDDGSGLVSIAEYVQDITGGQLIEGTAIDITYDDVAGTSTISASAATTTDLGVASFATADFNVTAGAVELKDTVVKGITTDSGALTPTTHAFSILGGEGIDVTHSGTTITVAGELASTTNIGVASFNSNNFQVSAGGEVSIKPGSISPGDLTDDAITIGTTTITLGGASTSILGLTEVEIDNLNFNGNTISAIDANGNVVLSPDGTGTVDVSSARITSVADPSDAQDAATKAYVDSVATGLDVKKSVLVATTGNITLSGTQTIDGIAVVAGDRVLVKNQTDKKTNGIYVVAAGAWSRSADADNTPTGEVTSGMFTFVEKGTVNADTGWALTTNDPITLGTTDLDFTQFSGAGTYSGGDGLSLTGTVFSVNVANGIEISADNVQLASTVAGAGLTYSSGVIDVGGTADRITVNADSIDIASTYVGQTSITTLGTITTGTWNGTTIAPNKGGTGITSYSYGDLLVGNVSGTLSALTVGASGKVLQSNGSTVVYGDVDGGTY